MSPFEKTLKGTFVIPEKENDIFCVKEDQQGSFCVQLIVSVKDYEGNIKIFWPEGLIPDSTQAVFEDVKTRTEDLYEAGELTLWMKPYTSRTYRFFKNRYRDRLYLGYAAKSRGSRLRCTWEYEKGI